MALGLYLLQKKRKVLVLSWQQALAQVLELSWPELAFDHQVH
jgi:hypothetical protein